MRALELGACGCGGFGAAFGVFTRFGALALRAME